MGPAAQGGLSVFSRQFLKGSRQTVAFFWDDVAIDIPQRGRMGEDSEILSENAPVGVFLQSVVHGLSTVAVYYCSCRDLTMKLMAVAG